MAKNDMKLKAWARETRGSVSVKIAEFAHPPIVAYLVRALAHHRWNDTLPQSTWAFLSNNGHCCVDRVLVPESASVSIAQRNGRTAPSVLQLSFVSADLLLEARLHNLERRDNDDGLRDSTSQARLHTTHVTAEH